MTTSAHTRGAVFSDDAVQTFDLELLRAMLLEQRAFRVEQLMELHGPAQVGRLKRPLISTDHEVFASLAAGARAALHDVQSALWRMDEGRYGLCTSCHRPLGIERLEILPQVALCMPCQRTADTAPGAA